MNWLVRTSAQATRLLSCRTTFATVLYLCFQAVTSASETLPPNASPDSLPNAAEPQLLANEILDAIVLVRGNDKGSSATATGVIVSPAGHVVVGWPAAIVQFAEKGELAVRLRSGEELDASLIAHNMEYRIALLKLKDPQRRLDHLRLGDEQHGKTGDAVLQLGYKRAKLVTSSGVINRAVGDVWGTSTSPNWTFGGALIDSEGRLVGVITQQCAPFLREIKPNPNGKREAVHTRSARIVREWKQWLVEDQNLPAPVKNTRAPKLRPPGNNEHVNQEDAITQAREASIRIRRRGSDPNGGSSGVIVTPDGYIITCGHHFMLAGDKVTITLSDGSEKPGHILGTNWVTDICIAKLDENGPWPFAPMASTDAVEAGNECITIGYATRGRRPDRSLAPRELTVATSKIVRTSSTRLNTSGRRVPGESGGGVFNLQGQVLGIGEGWGQDRSTQHLRVELFVRQWDFLVGQARENTETRKLSETR